jgi:hypothetical protein
LRGWVAVFGNGVEFGLEIFAGCAFGWFERRNRFAEWLKCNDDKGCGDFENSDWEGKSGFETKYRSVRAIDLCNLRVSWVLVVRALTDGVSSD